MPLTYCKHKVTALHHCGQRDLILHPLAWCAYFYGSATEALLMEAFRLGLRYVDNWSIMLDLQILWKTFSAVMHGSGAY